MTTQQKQYHDQVSKKFKTCLMVSLTLVLSLTLTKMVFSNRASTWGSDLNRIKIETEKTKAENLKLQSQLAKQSGGLTSILKEAQEKGFTSQLTYKHFSKTKKVAQNLP